MAGLTVIYYNYFELALLQLLLLLKCNILKLFISFPTMDECDQALSNYHSSSYMHIKNRKQFPTLKRGLRCFFIISQRLLVLNDQYFVYHSKLYTRWTLLCLDNLRKRTYVQLKRSSSYRAGLDIVMTIL